MATYPGYKEVFPKKNTLLAVVHVKDYHQAFESINVLVDEGVDGAFLISHGQIGYTYLSGLLMAVKDKNPNFWMGLNFLDVSLIKNSFLYTPLESDGLWEDNAGIVDSFVDKENNFSRDIWNFRKTMRNDWKGLYFGGVAFKYQAQPSDLSYVSKAATQCMDVITTSGDQTGEPPSIEKVSVIREAIGGFPLAVASGMTPENVNDFISLVDCFLVSTGISSDFYTFDPKKVANFVKAIS
ncbi:BtpA/SgcQ family protein [Patescibacteria group bacterium]